MTQTQIANDFTAVMRIGRVELCPRWVRMDLLQATPASDRGAEFQVSSLAATGKSAEKAARLYASPPAELASLQGMITCSWNTMDAWYEEDEVDTYVDGELEPRPKSFWS